MIRGGSGGERAIIAGIPWSFLILFDSGKQRKCSNNRRPLVHGYDIAESTLFPACQWLDRILDSGPQ